ncbi:MAG: hypothetical protein QF357_00205 [Dehalococcoidia bacterium]|jgi:hypothetical protein|nr:hypothetical protein [Dehalococcoidia bacterium]
MTGQQSDYFEHVRAPGRVFAFLGLLLGATAGVLTGIAIKGLIDEPLVTGGSAVVFYAAFGASSLITLFVMLNYLIMSLQVSDDGVGIKIGMKSASIALGDIEAVRVADTESRMSRAMNREGRTITQMWTVLGVGSGIEIDFSAGRGSGDDASSQIGNAQTWFVASYNPATLCEKLELLITKHHPESVTSSDPEPPTLSS